MQGEGYRFLDHSVYYYDVLTTLWSTTTQPPFILSYCTQYDRLVAYLSSVCLSVRPSVTPCIVDAVYCGAQVL